MQSSQFKKAPVLTNRQQLLSIQNRNFLKQYESCWRRAQCFITATFFLKRKYQMRNYEPCKIRGEAWVMRNLIYFFSALPTKHPTQQWFRNWANKAEAMCRFCVDFGKKLSIIL